MKRAAMKIVPKLLNFKQKQSPMGIAQEMLTAFNYDPEPPYSPDLAPADSFLFPKLKTPMKRTRFTAIEENRKEKKSKQELLAIRKSVKKCFEDQKKR